MGKVKVSPATLHHNHVKAPKNWVGSYFYVHAIAGFVLASFLFAGLTGFAE